ncbi:hypothetical protein [Desulfitispora alkaliphila]|uniref:hypothetical protein n=1 Tax=Desulfitispora alkaliphila TaxID=622674 RepID=UPI003D21B523
MSWIGGFLTISENASSNEQKDCQKWESWLSEKNEHFWELEENSVLLYYENLGGDN